MKQTYLKSFCARFLTLLVLALLSTNLAWGANVTYTKVTSSPTDWSGDYILVYEVDGAARVFTGVDAVSDFVNATISNNTITGEFVTLTLETTDGGYLVKINGGDNNGKYISNTKNTNDLSFGTIGAVMTMSYDNNSVSMTNAGGAVMCYNKASNQNRFRFYKSASVSDQQPVQLYKVSSTPTPTRTLQGIYINGTATKLEYYTGDSFDPAGLKVMGKYNDELGDAEITSGITWEFDPEVFTSTDQTSVSVTATVGDVDSSPYTVNGLIVKTIGNTQETAYTVAQAKALIDAGNGLNTEVYVKGTVSQVDGLNEDGTITYWLDNNAFEVYKGKKSETEYFTLIDEVKYGAEVIVYGKIKKFNSTYEFDAGNYLVSYTTPAKDLPTITFTYKTPLIVGEEGQYTVEYDGDGELEVTSSKTDVAEATISGKAVSITAKAAGTTTIKISAPETDNYYAVEETYTLTVIAPASLPFAFDGGINDIKNDNGMAQSGLGDDYKSAPLLKFDGTGDNLVIRFDGQADYVSYDIKGNSFKDGKFEVMESADGEEYTSVESYTTLGNTKTETKTLKSDTRYVKFVYTNKKEGNVALGNINIGKAQEVTITDAKYATLGLPYAVEIPDGVSAYTATVDGTTVTMTKISAIPANCGVILYAEAPGDYTFTQTLPPNLAVTNKLVAVIDEIYTCGDDYGKDYYLGLSNGQATFKKLNAGGTIAAGKAYLKLDAALPDGAKLEITFGEPTGIESLTPALSEGKGVYNLNGMRVNPSTGSGQAYKAYKGIVIMNGKKYINK